jgi:hypothetical protein
MYRCAEWIKSADIQFYQHCIDCIKAAKIDYIWLIGFRGSGDHPFWESGDKGIVVGETLEMIKKEVI